MAQVAKKAAGGKRPPAAQRAANILVLPKGIIFYVSGVVSWIDKEQAYEIAIPRRGSSKTNDYRIPLADVKAATTGPAGWILTDDPRFATIANGGVFAVPNAQVSATEIQGADEEGNTIYVNRANLPCAVSGEIVEA